MTKVREPSEHRPILDITGQCTHLVSDVRLDIPCSILDIQSFFCAWPLSDWLKKTKKRWVLCGTLVLSKI